VKSDFASITLLAFAVAIASVVKNITKKSKTCKIVEIPAEDWTVKGFLNRHMMIPEKGTVILIKRVSKDFKTQEGTRNETLWEIGTTLEHASWNPESGECGEGKYHACAEPFFCDAFRNEKSDDKYIAIEVAVKDMHAWKNPDYPHKIAFRKGKVLHQVNIAGVKL